MDVDQKIEGKFLHLGGLGEMRSHNPLLKSLWTGQTSVLCKVHQQGKQGLITRKFSIFYWLAGIFRLPNQVLAKNFLRSPPHATDHIFLVHHIKKVRQELIYYLQFCMTPTGNTQGNDSVLTACVDGRKI